MRLLLQSYLLIQLVTAWHTCCAQAENDSVFSSARICSFKLFSTASGRDVNVPAGPISTPRLFVFLSPDCPICQSYSRTLNELNKQYAGKVIVYGIFPGKTVKAEEVKAFGLKYGIGYPLWLDPSMQLSRYLQATVTPEAILLDPQNNLIYKGAIDNRYRALGKPGARTTENYLADALERTVHQERPVVKRTRPVGCMLNDF